MKTRHLPKLFTLIACIILLGLAGCSSSDTPAAPEPAGQAEDAVETAPEGAASDENSDDTEPVVLKIYNWDDYIDPQILSDFEEEFNVSIDQQIFVDEADLINAVENGEPYDLIVTSDYYVQQLWQDDLLARLNHENIPNMANLDPAFADPVYDPDNRHCLPYQWGTVGFAYRESVTGPITGWEDIFNPKHAGRIGLMNDDRLAMGLVLLYLGYSPNTNNPLEIAEAADYLMSMADIIGGIHDDDGQDFLMEGVYDIVLEYSGDILLLMAEDPDVRYFVPPTGSNIWVDNICIPSSAENKEMAEAFMNYLLEPEVGAALSNYVQYGSPNQAAIPLLPEEDLNNPAIYPPPEVRSFLFPFVILDEASTSIFGAYWGEFRAAVEES